MPLDKGHQFAFIMYRDGTGLPDGIFSNQKSQIELIFKGLVMEELVYFIALWFTLRPFSIFFKAIW
jgi:hypothetical protein